MAWVIVSRAHGKMSAGYFIGTPMGFPTFVDDKGQAEKFSTKAAARRKVRGIGRDPNEYDYERAA